MSYAKMAALGGNAQGISAAMNISPQPVDPALSSAAHAIERQLTNADEAMAQVFNALSRLIPPVPTTAGVAMIDASDGTLLGALATLENRAARLAQALGEAAVQLDRAV